MIKIIRIQNNGTVSFIYDDKLSQLLEHGEAKVVRASHVEPDRDKQNRIIWRADMAPVAGPVLGPFPTREQALAAEVSWLNHNRIPIPQEASS